MGYARTALLLAALTGLFLACGWLIGGPRGPEPTRYGDWERNGRVSDF